jgi:hypothetical protein
MTTKRLKRSQGRGEEGVQRAPMPAWIPRPLKRESGRTDPLRTPAHVRLIGVDLDDDEQAYVRRTGYEAREVRDIDRAHQRSCD